MSSPKFMNLGLRLQVTSRRRKVRPLLVARTLSPAKPCHMFPIQLKVLSQLVHLYEDSPHHDIHDIQMFPCLRNTVPAPHHDIWIFFGQEKTTIFMFIQYMSHIQYVLSGSLVGLMWELETSWNFNDWFYSNDKWGWLCVIQYPVWWQLILRYCYTYDIYKISLTETIDLYFSLQIQTMSISQDIFGNFVSKVSVPQHEQAVSVLNHKNHIVWL